MSNVLAYIFRTDFLLYYYIYNQDERHLKTVHFSFALQTMKTTCLKMQGHPDRVFTCILIINSLTVILK